MRVSPEPFDQRAANAQSHNKTPAQHHKNTITAAAKIQRSIDKNGWPATVSTIAQRSTAATLAEAKIDFSSALQATSAPAQRTAATHDLRTAQAVISAAEKVKQSPQPGSSGRAPNAFSNRARTDSARQSDIAFVRARLGGTYSALEIIDGLMHQPQGLSIAAGGFKSAPSRQQAVSALKAALKEERADLARLNTLMKKDTLNHVWRCAILQRTPKKTCEWRCCNTSEGPAIWRIRSRD
jgi:hypothetical protein